MQGFSRLGGLFIRAFVSLAAVGLACSSSWASEEAVASAIQNAPSTHKQKTVVTVASAKDGSKLEDFCIDANGHILALLGASTAGEFGEDGSVLAGALRLLQGATAAPPKFECAVHLFDAKGDLLEKWPVGFTGQAINIASDGTILIGGDGRIARFDAKGTKLQEEESPQMTYIAKHPEEMRERAKEQLESDLVTYADQVKQLEDQLKELAESKKEERGKEEKAEPAEPGVLQLNEATLKQIIASYKSHLKTLEKQTVDDVLNQVMTRAKRINAICASKGDVFVTCPAMQGYGYGVWRTDETFGNAKEIVKSLSGCCGQMDVQCCNGELYVCENSKHRVVRFDRDGKEIAEFGKRDREGNGENFGGCCNPMNLCFNKGGDLYVSESNGVVKRFTPAGKYLGVVGIANVEPGCKNSCVAATADDGHLFYIDIHKSQIIVLARDDSQASK